MKLNRIPAIIVRHILIIVLTILICACGLQDRWRNRQLMNNAEQLLVNMPDSALHLLNSVSTGLLDQRDHARFLVLRTRAKEKNGMDISPDSLIFEACDYLVEKKDKYAALACFVSASVYDVKGNLTKAVNDYRKAAELVTGSNDLLKGTIHYNLGRVYYLQKLYSESLPYVKRAKIYEDLAGIKDDSKVYTLELIALNYLYLSETDSSLLYFDKALLLASRNNDLHTRKRISQGMAVSLREAGEYWASKEKCWQVLASKAPEDSIITGRIYLTLARIYDETGHTDSAYLYGYRSLPLLGESDDIIDRKDLNMLLASAERKMNHPEKALHFEQLYKAYVFAVRHAEQQVEEERKKYRDYEFQQMQDTNNRLLIHSLRQRNIIIILVSVLIVIIGIFFFRRYRKRQADRLVQERQQYTEAIESIRTMMNDERMKVFFRIEDLVELKNLSYEKQNGKQIREQIKKMLNYYRWDDVYPVINDMYNSLFDRIRADFPQLTVKEYQTCCLIVMGFGLVIVSVILEEDSRTSQNRQTQIRKELEIEPRSDIRAFFINRYDLKE